MDRNLGSQNLRGCQIKQKTVMTDLDSVEAGQTLFTRIALVTFIVVVCFLASFLTGYLGGLAGLWIVIGFYRLQCILMLIVLLFWITIASYKTLSQSLIFATLVAISAIGGLEILVQMHLLKFSPGFFVSALSLVIVGLTSTVGSFLLLRLSSAVVNILLINAKSIKILIVMLLVIAAIFGSQAAKNAVFSATSPAIQSAISELSNIERTIANVAKFASAVGLSLLIAFSSWRTNRLRNLPWNHLDVLRDWVLAIGCWGGTSFHNLDLSNVNFTGATLANTDLRAKLLYRTCFRNVIGLNRARVDNQYLDLNNPKVQRLLTQGTSQDRQFHRFNLQGAYLQEAEMREFDLTDADLTGADLQRAMLRDSVLVRTKLSNVNLKGSDLRDSNLTDTNLTGADCRETDLRDAIFVRAQVARVDFSGADLTGICIEDWSVSSQTNFQNVRCDYVYRKYKNGERTARYPVDRNFEAGEFAFLFQQLENELELVFKGEEFDYTALSLTFDRLQTEKLDLKLKLQGIEQRQDLWVVKVTSDDPANVERRIKEIQDAVYQGYEATTTRLENDPLIRRIISDVANIKKTQEEIGEEVNQLAKRIGSNFYFLGGTITNVTGAGEIKYTEASNQVRSLVTGDGHETQVVNTLLNQLRSSNVATTANEQTELIQFVILEEAQRDPQFKQFLLQQAQQILAALPESSIATALRGAIATLNSV